jgi:tetratricopeptide (TPR) repeat protein
VTGQAIGFIGALIGGVAANRRKAKLEELAQKLKGVNSQLRQQARQAKEGQYAPEAAAEECLDECEIQQAAVLEMLKRGKGNLRNGQADMALTYFKRALELIAESEEIEEPKVAERKAYRGIGGAQVMLGAYDSALSSMQQVLTLTRDIGDRTGLCDAYGVIADIYTELEQYQKAAEYYDLYIETLNQDQASETE